MQHHREEVTLECYSLLPITLSPGLGCLVCTYRSDIPEVIMKEGSKMPRLNVLPPQYYHYILLSVCMAIVFFSACKTLSLLSVAIVLFLSLQDSQSPLL